MNNFYLLEDDYYAIDIAKNTIRRFLKHPRIETKQIIGLGNALYALERLPEITEGSDCEFGIEYRHGTDEFNEMRYLNFHITEGFFCISAGGSTHDKAGGGDSYSTLDWYIEASGARCTEGELCYLEDGIVEYLNLGGKISVTDNSELVSSNQTVYIEDKIKKQKDKIIAFESERICAKIKNKAIKYLQSLTDCLLSGDDTLLKNVWDEICVQVQDEESFYWDAYIDTIERFVSFEVSQLKKEERQAVWLQTNEGQEWVDQIDDAEEDEKIGEIPDCIDEIVRFILDDYILYEAGSYTNKRIEEYLENY